MALATLSILEILMLSGVRARFLASVALFGCMMMSGSAAVAQSTGTGKIVGRIIDAATGQGLPETQVSVVGPQLGALSGVDGRFTINAVPAGTVTLQVRRIGYASKTVTGILMDAGKTLEQDISLQGAAVSLAATTVTASVERGSVSNALDAQRTAAGVVNSVTAEQIAKSPDGNAAQAVQRVSGVTVQDNKFVFVRGLGERYTTSSLNGARLPSPEPEKRTVPLDMFPAGLVQTITTIKTFTPDQQGDFAGALVDIKTREFPARRAATLNIGTGMEAGATSTGLLTPQRSGGEGFAMVNSGRDIPSLIKSAGNLIGLNLSQGDKNLLISQFRNAWTPSIKNGSPLLNGSASIGGNQPIFGHRLGYLISGTISSGTDLKSEQVRALADRGNVKGSTLEIDRFSGTTSQQSVLWGGLTNLSTMIGSSSRISFNGLYNRTADNTAREEAGIFSNDGTFAKITRMQYVERSVQSLQLSGDHQFGTRHRIEWAATSSGVRRYEPDKSEFIQVLEKDTPSSAGVYRWFSGGSGGAVRTFSELHERSGEGSAKYALSFGPAGMQNTVTVGGLYRTTNRTTDNRAFNISGHGLNNTIRELPAEQLFDGRYTQTGSALFDIAPLSQGGAYDAHDTLTAGFAMAEIPLGSRFRLIGGARYESDRLRVNAVSTLGNPVNTTKRWNDVLPSLALNVRLSESQQLRLSGSRTLARPEYRELSPIIGRDVVGGDDVQGNENLERTNVTNMDLRWEWYPRAGEIVSVGVFTKNFVNPIERVYRASSSARQIVYVNGDKAEDYGVELELRKGLDFLSGSLSPLAVFSNLTVMHSQVHLNATTGTSQTNLNRAMVGQAPYVLNAGLTYSSGSGNTTATLLFNKVGERIDVAGESPLPDVVLQSRNVLDFSVRVGISGAITLRADLRNLLDAPYESVQGTVIRDHYLTGRTVQAGLQIRR